MDNLLIQYLATKDHVALGRLGSLIKKKIPAQLSPSAEAIYAPAETLALMAPGEGEEVLVDEDFIRFLSQHYDASTTAMRQKAQAYIDNILNDLAEKGERKIEGIGTLQQKNNGDILFHRDTIAASPVLQASKIIHDNSMHMLQVGDRQVSSYEMQDYLENRDKENYTWMYWTIGGLALTLSLLAIINFM